MRRGFGRPVRPLRQGIAADVPPLLRRANQMLSSGNYGEAASAYEQLARAAEARGGPRAPFFYVQAGRSRIMAGQTAPGVEQLERGIGLFAMRGQAMKALNVGNRIVGELNARGLNAEAQKIADYVKELVPDSDRVSQSAASSKRPALPTHCPGCGAPLRPDEVEWQDDVTALCEYCGSPVHGE